MGQLTIANKLALIEESSIICSGTSVSLSPSFSSLLSLCSLLPFSPSLSPSLFSLLCSPRLSPSLPLPRPLFHSLSVQCRRL